MITSNAAVLNMMTRARKARTQTAEALSHIAPLTLASPQQHLYVLPFEYLPFWSNVTRPVLLNHQTIQ